MAIEQSWVNELRAETLAMIVLTRHEGVDVIPISRHSTHGDKDLLVRIDQNGATGANEFAVVTWGVRGPEARANRPLRVRVDPQRIERMPQPVLFLVFDVDSEEGYFAWLIEPVIAAGGTPELRPNRRLWHGTTVGDSIVLGWSDLDGLDDQAVNTIVQRVAEWSALRDRAVSPLNSRAMVV